MRIRTPQRWAAGVFAASVALSAPATAAIEVDGQMLEVVDMHLHTGYFGQMPNNGVGFVVESTPPQARLFIPELAGRILDPYAEQIGIKAHTEMASVDHAVLLSTYTQRTSGYITNAQLLSLLQDSRNVASASGRPWAWGMASINFDDFSDPEIAQDRLAALGSYLEYYPDLIIGIKLAHAHQNVAFDSPDHMGVYEVASTHGVPMLLHTGFSVYPNSSVDPATYDPIGLEDVIKNYDGNHGLPIVRFVLAHVGTGDARAVEHALYLAEKYPNVFLDLSAIKGPVLLDEDGNPSSSTQPLYQVVLEELKTRRLVDRAMWSSDGPQFPGMVGDYLKLLVEGMKEAGYSTDEIAKVLAGNFYDVFFPQSSG